jgi:hypothetical protein
MVIDNETDSAIVFNTNTNTILGAVGGFGGDPSLSGDCSITPDGAKGFFTRFDSNITVVDLTTTPPTQAHGRNPIPIANAGQNTAVTPMSRVVNDPRYRIDCLTRRMTCSSCMAT